jgi:hypothetical protein
MTTEKATLLEWFRKLKMEPVLFVVLACCFTDPYVSSNEEVYFAWAKHHADPSWMRGSFTFSEWPGARLLFQWIAGPLLGLISFERLAQVGTALNLVLMAIPLAKIFRHFSLSKTGAVFLILVFCVSDQAFFAGEWIFGNFEPKTISYPLVFYGLYSLLISDLAKATAYFIAAAYLHILVGGWVFLAMLLYLLARRVELARIAAHAGAFAVGLSPLLIYLIHYMSNTAAEKDGVHASWIYVFFRNPHHVAPFVDGDINARFLPGIVAAGVAYLICWFYFRRLENARIRNLNSLNLVILGMLFVSLIIGYFDETGFFLKFYPFRIAAVSLFLIILQLIVFLGEVGGKWSRGKGNQIAFSWIVASAFLFVSCTRMQDAISDKAADRRARIARTAVFARENSAPGDVFLFLDVPESKNSTVELSFMRRAERERFVMRKFVPTGDKIYEWYHRLNERRKTNEDIYYLKELRKNYRIDFVASREARKVGFLQEVFHDDDGYYIYKLVL